SVSSADMQRAGTVNAVDALKGRVAGVDIAISGNKPGDGFRVRVRGDRSFQASNDPLYVLDGIPMSGGIGDINPNDTDPVEGLMLHEAPQMSHEVRSTGGDEKTRFSLSAGLLNQQGIRRGQDFQRRSMRLNFEHRPSPRLVVGSSTSVIRTEQNLGRGDGLYSESLQDNPLGMAYDSTGQ